MKKILTLTALGLLFCQLMTAVELNPITPYYKQLGINQYDPATCEVTYDYREVVNCPDKTKEQIIAAISNWISAQVYEYKVVVSNLTTVDGVVTFKMAIPVGKKHYGKPSVAIFKDLNWDSFISEITFTCTIEVKDGRYRFTIDTFRTERWFVRLSDAISEGPSSFLHQQRVTALTQERDKAKEGSAKYIKKNQMIEMENQADILEKEAVWYIVESLRRCTEVVEDF